MDDFAGLLSSRAAGTLERLLHIDMGVIGFDFIARFVNEIDYDARTLVLRDPATFEYQGRGAAIPMTLAGHAPVVKLTLDGEFEGQFRIDVGSGSTVDLHAPFVRRFGLERAFAPGIEVLGGGFGGSFKNRITRAASLATPVLTSIPRDQHIVRGSRSDSSAIAVQRPSSGRFVPHEHGRSRPGLGESRRPRPPHPRAARPGRVSGRFPCARQAHRRRR